MALVTFTPSVTVSGLIGADPYELQMEDFTVTPVEFDVVLDLDITATLVPATANWTDYGTNPLGYTFTIINSSVEAFTGPIAVSIGGFDANVTYTEGTALAGADTVIENVAFASNALSFDISGEIAAGASAIVTFSVEKPTVE